MLVYVIDDCFLSFLICFLLLEPKDNCFCFRMFGYVLHGQVIAIDQVLSIFLAGA